MILTFLDASVLIAAHRAARRERELALALVNDRNRSFVSSPFLSLETVPKATYFNKMSELSFYRTYFDEKVAISIEHVREIADLARQEAESCGLGALDALHVAAAYLAEAEELVTLEKPGRAIYRAGRVRVVHLDSAVTSAR